MKKSENKALYQSVEKAIDTVRPYLEEDGGDVEVVEITDDKVVKLRLLGNCKPCPMSSVTMRAGLEEAIKSHTPNIKGVEAINANTSDQ
jgi:Fe-S cluster biogenesis protein NfuA